MTDCNAGEKDDRWDMTLTRELVEAKYGRELLNRLRPVLRAVSTRLVHAQFHFQDYSRLVHTHLSEPSEQGAHWSELMWVDDKKEVGPNNYFFIASEGYIYACAQALHAIADNLAHVAYYAMGWSLEGSPTPRDVSLGSVLKKLQRDAIQTPGYRPIEQAFTALSASEHYRALTEVTNHLKHHGGLAMRVSWGASAETPFRVFLSEFQRPDQQHPQREVSEFLEAAHETMGRAAVNVGRSLNAWLRENP